VFVHVDDDSTTRHCRRNAFDVPVAFVRVVRGCVAGVGVVVVTIGMIVVGAHTSRDARAGRVPRGELS
jgi:hypothetical protein